MTGRLILDRDDAFKIAAVGHVAATDKARPNLCEIMLAWVTAEDGKVTVKATATDSYCAAIRTVPAEVTEGTPPRGEAVIEAKAFIAAVKATERFQQIVTLDLDGETLIVGGRILPLDTNRDFPPVQAKIEGVVYADSTWSPKRYGMLPAFSTTIFAKIVKASGQPDLPIRMWCLPDMPGDTWLKPIKFTVGSSQDFRAWQMPVRI